MEKISKDTLVTLSLEIKLKEDGTVVDNSEELMYLHGSYDQIFQKVEDELDGKTIGNKFDISLSPSDAFGEYNEALVIRESLSELPENAVVGMELDGEEEDLIWVIESIENGFATLNANHEMAGVPFQVVGEVLNVQKLSDSEVQNILNMGHEH